MNNLSDSLRKIMNNTMLTCPNCNQGLSCVNCSLSDSLREQRDKLLVENNYLKKQLVDMRDALKESLSISTPDFYKKKF